jgi:hypothetical protein
MNDYLAHNHTERNHQGKNNALLFRQIAETRRDEPVRCRDPLGGLTLGRPPQQMESSETAARSRREPMSNQIVVSDLDQVLAAQVITPFIVTRRIKSATVILPEFDVTAVSIASALFLRA